MIDLTYLKTIMNHICISLQNYHTRNFRFDISPVRLNVEMNVILYKTSSPMFSYNLFTNVACPVYVFIHLSYLMYIYLGNNNITEVK